MTDAETIRAAAVALRKTDPPPSRDLLRAIADTLDAIGSRCSDSAPAREAAS
jgi:hypothetical protein